MKPTFRSLLIVLVVMVSVVFLLGPKKVLAQVIGMFTEVQSLPGDVPGTKVPFRTLNTQYVQGGGSHSLRCDLNLGAINPSGEFTIETVAVDAEIPIDEVPRFNLAVFPADPEDHRASSFFLAATNQGTYNDYYGLGRLNHFTGTHAIRVHVRLGKGERAAVFLERFGDFSDGQVSFYCTAAGYVTPGEVQEPPPNK